MWVFRSQHHTRRKTKYKNFLITTSWIVSKGWCGITSHKSHSYYFSLISLLNTCYPSHPASTKTTSVPAYSKRIFSSTNKISGSLKWTIRLLLVLSSARFNNFNIVSNTRPPRKYESTFLKPRVLIWNLQDHPKEGSKSGLSKPSSNRHSSSCYSNRTSPLIFKNTSIIERKTQRYTREATIVVNTKKSFHQSTPVLQSIQGYYQIKRQHTKSRTYSTIQQQPYPLHPSKNHHQNRLYNIAYRRVRPRGVIHRTPTRVTDSITAGRQAGQIIIQIKPHKDGEY